MGGIINKEFVVIVKCWTCSRFKAKVKRGTKMRLACGYDKHSKWSKEEGFYHEGCPKYKRDV